MKPCTAHSMFHIRSSVVIICNCDARDINFLWLNTSMKLLACCFDNWLKAPFSKVSDQRMNGFSWNFQDRSDMNKTIKKHSGTFGIRLLLTWLKRFLFSQIRRCGGLRSRSASCWINVPAINLYSLRLLIRMIMIMFVSTTYRSHHKR